VQCGCFERAVELVQLYIGNRGVCAAIKLFSVGVRSFSHIPTFEIFLPFLPVVSSTEIQIWFSPQNTRNLNFVQRFFLVMMQKIFLSSLLIWRNVSA
jgi:hypothetical protein